MPMQVQEIISEASQTPSPITSPHAQWKKAVFSKPILALELGGDYIVWSLHRKSPASCKFQDSGLLVKKGMSDPEVYYECLNELLDRLNLTEGEVSLFLSQEDALLRCIYIPVVPGNELRKVVIWEGNKVFPFPVDKALFDWRIVNCIDWGGSKKYEVQCAAIPFKDIQPAFDLLKSRGLHINRISLSALAWQEFIHDNRPGESSRSAGNLALTRLVGNNLFVLFFHDYNLEFIHKSNLESGSLGGSFEESLRFLNDDSPGLLSDSMQTSALDYGIIARNISDSMDYYHGQFSQRSIGTVLLCFPTGIWKSAARQLQDSLGLPVKSVFPARFHDTPNGNVPLNLLMPSAYQGRHIRKSLNLVPAEYRRESREKHYFRTTALCAALLMIFLMIFTFLQYRQEKYLETSRDSLRITLDEVSGSDLAGKINKLQLQKNEFNRALNMLNNKSQGLAAFMKALSVLTPQPIYFNSLTITVGQQIESGTVAAAAISGFVGAGADYPEVVLAEYVNSLKGLDFISNIRLGKQDSQNEKESGQYGFRLEMELKEL